MKMLVDSHCHLIGGQLDETGLAAVLERALDAGVDGLVAVAAERSDWRPALALAAAPAGPGRPAIQASLGLHPHEAAGWNAAAEAELRDLLADPNARFVGETGLDWHYDFGPRAAQEAAFRAQIRLARLAGKPLVIHTREAPEETLAILAEEGAAQVGGIIHCFSEDLPFARRALDLGFHLSFSGIVTFKNATAIQEVAAWAPGDRILVETDSPYLAPVPHRGKPNEPAHVVHVAARVAQLRGISAERLGELTTRNLEALCGWPRSC
jgi:TatD DNase family protein